MGPLSSPDKSSDASVITPQTGAAKYWYVDPRADRTFNPMQQNTEDELAKLRAALERMGVVPQGEKPSL